MGPIQRSLALVALITACLVGITRVADLSHVSIVYLVAVLIAATRWGAIPAIAAAVGGVIASAFFFYAPLYDLRVYDPQQIMDLALFISVAVVTGHLADSTRAHMRAAQKSEQEVRSLYAFSKRLAVASTGEEILASARDHLSATLGHRVLLFQMHPSGDAAPLGEQAENVPETVLARVSQPELSTIDERSYCVDDATGSIWLVGPVSHGNPALGMVAIDVGYQPTDDLERLRQQLDAALADASATLERLDVAHALEEARARSSRETFREALIGSVSHELRTPLSAILGAASVLSRTQTVAGDGRLAELADIVHCEAERLDNDIEKLLDASRISGEGLRPQPIWTDPSDLVNAALELRGRAHRHQIEVRVPDDLPLVYIDPALIKRALRQIVDNAVKYSPLDSTIVVGAWHLGDRIAVFVRDEGMGVTVEEKERLFERFYRSPRHAAAQTGSGLGLWIARAFVAASGGQLSIESGGRDQGTTVILQLPVPKMARRDAHDDSDE
jgi:two-component system sensor histidine kinase KdpD